MRQPKPAAPERKRTRADSRYILTALLLHEPTSELPIRHGDHC